MRMTGIIYTGEHNTINNLYQRYCDRLEQGIDVSIIGSNNTYLGRVKHESRKYNFICYNGFDFGKE